MKRKILFMILFIAILSVIMAIPSFAASSSVKGVPDPIEVNAGKKCFFANGAAITISARTDGEEGALIAWNGGELLVEPDITVFGGMHNNSTPVDSNITMTGGTIKNIIGGGLHESNTTSSTILITGGTITAVQGGGAAAFATKCSEIDASYDNCSKSYSPTDEIKADSSKSVCYTGKANVTLKGNTVVTSTVYGGGQGYSHTGEAIVNISENVDVSSGWVTAGGANGSTTKATLNITGGKFKYVQSVNRGTMDSAAVKVTGGTIESLYVGGIPVETTDKVQGTGTINSVSLEVGEKATVNNLQAGSSGSLTPVDLKSDNVNVKVSNSAKVDNNTIKSDVTIVYTVIIDGIAYSVEEGKTIKDIPEYTKITEKEGYKFIGFKLGTEDWDVETVITGDYDLTTVFEKEIPEIESDIEIEKEEEVVKNPENPQEGEKDNTPKTGTVNIPSYVWVMLLAMALVGIATIKKEVKKGRNS